MAESEIAYQRVDHPPVFTYAEAEDNVPPLPGIHTKNLFLRDGKGWRHFLVVVDCAMQVDLKALRKVLETDKLGMASPERAVEVVFDKAVWEAEAIQCHPLVNTSTLVIRQADVERLLERTGHAWRVVAVPVRAQRDL